MSAVWLSTSIDHQPYTLPHASIFSRKKVCSLCFGIIPLSAQVSQDGGQIYHYLFQKPLFQVKVSDVMLIVTVKSSSKKCPPYTTIDAHHLIAQEEPCSFTGLQGDRVLLLTELLSK